MNLMDDYQEQDTYYARSEGEISLASLDTYYCRMMTTGLIIADGISYDHWESIGNALQKIAFAIQWAIGDWINYGENHYGETYAQAINETGLNYQTLANYASVARRVEFYRRRENLSFAHHDAVAKLDGSEQSYFLAMAEEKDLSAKELRQLVNGIEPTLKKHICPQCGHEWSE